MWKYIVARAGIMIVAVVIATAADLDAQQTTDMQQRHVHGGATTGPLGISMDRMGSGTTWIPEDAPLPSVHRTLGSWELMIHGFGFLQYDKQGGPRGDEQFGSLNWGMLMASRGLAGGRIQLRTMLSLDPATVTANGYPLLLQTGETFDGEPLRDVQHPHDFLMEVAALYERELSPKLAFSLYAAPSGEPALNPVAFMHRPSAMDDPVAPLGHHWMDATHITFGVVTAGLFTRHLKVEGSLFNGEAPDERRWNIDRIKFDSFSGRVTVQPDSQWSLSAGYGFIESPPGHHSAGGKSHRLTAGILHGRKLGTDGQWAVALVGGGNKPEFGKWTGAGLLESEIILSRNTIIARMELVQKSGADLVLPSAGPNAVDPLRDFNLSSFSAGYIREIARPLGASLGIGARGTINFVPGDLEVFYGSRTPLGAFVFLRIRPS